MNSSRKITSYFRRPDFVSGTQNTQSDTPAEDPAPALQSSPIPELPELPPSDGTTPDTPGGPSAQLKRSLLHSTKDTANNDPAPQSSFQSVGTGSSFGSSQRRVFKKGREVVISSDGEESDSSASLEPPEELLSFMKPPPPKVRFTDDSEMDHDSSASGRALRSRKNPNTRSASHYNPAPRPYKNSLDSLVMQAVSENETEAGIARLRESLKSESAQESESRNSKNVHEGILASALDTGTDDSMGLQRLLDAVRRTEAFDLGKSWSFFDLKTPLPPPPDFPRDCVCPGTYLAVLREPESRERAFYSGVLDFALSRDLLSDELVRWIFFSIPSEPRESLRHAYCRAIKRTKAERIKSSIQPEDIDNLFWYLSARPQALILSDPIVPDTQPNDRLESQPQHHTALISVLDVFREAADLFSSDTRDRILDILLRLPLDCSLTRHSIICTELERTITAILEGVGDNEADGVVTRICKTAAATLKDAELQSRVLEHIVPTNDWIATLRRRLALIFLTGDPHAEIEPPNGESEVKRITNIIRDPRFDVKRHKRKGQPEYDYGELRAITTFLNIIIDSGWSETKFSGNNTEKEFNREVDLLADRVKKIFTAIEDSGASHLKRTLAKEALESLHYRIVFSVRSKPRPKKVLYGEYDSERKSESLLRFLDKKVPIRIDKPDS
ncbi:hypothetical protein BJX63DRAFT_428317 [Aspergillus granulosus]|uniref:Uncharacterized protein n=1 Tax=Aspergillus granulosus TaxID=176169 RepID=A0ABR4HWW8_9EURO